jgi:hypothetical protein
MLARFAAATVALDPQLAQGLYALNEPHLILQLGPGGGAGGRRAIGGGIRERPSQPLHTNLQTKNHALYFLQ